MPAIPRTRSCTAACGIELTSTPCQHPERVRGESALPWNNGHDHGHEMVDPSRAIYVFDRTGELHLLMTSGRTVEQMAADMALLLKE